MAMSLSSAMRMRMGLFLGLGCREFLGREGLDCWEIGEAVVRGGAEVLQILLQLVELLIAGEALDLGGELCDAIGGDDGGGAFQGVGGARGGGGVAGGVGLMVLLGL